MINEILLRITETCDEFRRQNQRHGQALFNAVYSHCPEIADKIRGTSLDPFYKDNRVPAFWDEVQKNLAKNMNSDKAQE